MGGRRNAEQFHARRRARTERGSCKIRSQDGVNAMAYASRYPGPIDDDQTVPRPPTLPRFPTLSALPRFPSSVSLVLDEDASLTRPLPPRASRVRQRTIPTVRPPGRDARLPAIFYGLSAGVLLGAMLCITGVTFAPSGSTEEAAEPLFAAAGPSATRAAMHARMPGVRVEDLPRVLVRAEDLPMAPPVNARR